MATRLDSRSLIDARRVSLSLKSEVDTAIYLPDSFDAIYLGHLTGGQ